MIIKLSKNQFDYLGYSFSEDQKVLRLKLKEIRKENQSVIIEVDESTVDEIRDWASEELQKKGFDINYELTDEGKILEALIDAFYIK
ncbi:MAG TPA: hypothetical protein VL053_06940 [Arachidicoccus sp.]|nr:hypothetical protein [Arachidicoccus sp.]